MEKAKRCSNFLQSNESRRKYCYLSIKFELFTAKIYTKFANYLSMLERVIPHGSILPCGGRGVRLLSLTEGKIPKPLFRIGGKELIRYSTDILDPSIVKRLVFAVDNQADQIRRWVNEQALPHAVSFSEQQVPGVLAAITSASKHVEEDRMVACNTDEIRTGINLNDIIRFHERSGVTATIVATSSNNLFRHRVLAVRERDGHVLRTKLKPDEFRNKPDDVGLVNTGFMIIDKRAMDFFDPNHNGDWGGIIDPLCDAGQLNAYVNYGISYFNVGTPEEYEEADIFMRGRRREEADETPIYQSKVVGASL